MGIEAAIDASRTACCPEPPAVSCCTAFYEQEWVRRIAGGVFHPGGADLTRRTIAAMDLKPGAHVLDLACGTGSSAVMLASEGEFRLSAADRSRLNLDHARRTAEERIAPERLKFYQADAAHLPFKDGTFDGLLSECAFSLYRDKPAVLAEMRRVLKPAGRLGLTDMAVERELPPDLAAVAAPWMCLADTRSAAGYRRLFEEAGYWLAEFSDESDALCDMLGTIKRNLLLLLAGSALNGLPAAFDLVAIKPWLDRFAAEIEAGGIRYLRFNLERA